MGQRAPMNWRSGSLLSQSSVEPDRFPRHLWPIDKHKNQRQLTAVMTVSSRCLLDPLITTRTRDEPLVEVFDKLFDSRLQKDWPFLWPINPERCIHRAVIPVVTRPMLFGSDLFERSATGCE